MSSRKAPRHITAACMITAMVGAASCKKAPAPSEPAENLGAPTGVRLDEIKDAKGAVLGSLSIAFAVNEGLDPGPLVSGIAKAAHEAARSCPGTFEPLAHGESIRFKASVKTGQITEAGNLDSLRPELRCLPKAFVGKRIANDATLGLRSLSVEIQAAKAEKPL